MKLGFIADRPFIRSIPPTISASIPHFTPLLNRSVSKNPTASGRKNLVLRAQNFGYKGEQQLIGLMESEKEVVELNRNLYPNIEPYSTGFFEGFRHSHNLLGAVGKP